MPRISIGVARKASHYLAAAIFHVLLLIPKIKAWRDNQVTRYSFGSPPTQVALLRQLRKDIFAELGKLVKQRRNEAEKMRVRARIKRLPPINLTHKFIITLVDKPQSMQSAQRCIESARRHGEAEHLEIMPAVDKFHSEAVFKKNGLIWDAGYSPGTDQFAGMGCFASHYILWSQCVESGNPLVVLEHDVKFIRPIPALRFQDVMVLAKEREFPLISRSPTREIMHQGQHLYGTHAYAITPEGAQKLIQCSRRTFLFPVDWFMDKRHVDIVACLNPPLQLDASFSSIATWGRHLLGELELG